MERECNKCIHHTSGRCSSWDCKMQTVEDVNREARNKGIDDFAERLRQECLESPYKEVWLHTMLKIAEELKKNSNETQTEAKGE